MLAFSGYGSLANADWNRQDQERKLHNMFELMPVPSETKKLVTCTPQMLLLISGNKVPVIALWYSEELENTRAL